ncbi:ABC transporter permease [Myxococcota bacterium]|nr:ABC transporter permease [Myxococcota bacterium]
MRAELTALFKKELRQTFRDKRMASVLIIAPVLQSTVLGFAVDLEVEDVPAAIVDQDNSPASRALTRRLLSDGKLERVLDTDDPERPLTTGEANVVIVIPRRFGADLERGTPVEVQVLIDGTDPTRAQASIGEVQQVLQQEAISRAQVTLLTEAARRKVAPQIPQIELVPRVLYNPTLRTPVYMIPGVAAVVLLIVTTVVTAMGIAKEKELGTIEQILVTPLHPTYLLLGKVLPFAAIGLVTAGLVLSFGTHVFDVPIRGSLFVVFVGTLLYLLNTLGFGVLISTVAKNQQQAILGTFFFLLPAILLSGFMSPVENMPAWVQPLSLADPVRYYVEILRAVLLKGAGFADLAQQFVTLAIFGVALITIGSVRFHKRLG